MNTKRFLSLIATATVGTVLSANAANALSFAFNTYDSGAGTYSFDVILDPGEELRGNPINDAIAFTGLSGITGVNSTNNGSLQFTNTFDGVSANFETSLGATGAGTFSEAIILTSSSNLGTFNYSANSSAGAFNGTITPVPFEPEANLGVFTILGLIGFSRYRKKLRSQKSETV